MAETRTWSGRHGYHWTWEHVHGKPRDWMPLYIRRLACGCYVDDLSDGAIWEPCMAHEGEGHLAVLSEQDGLHVARCLVLICDWQTSLLWEVDAISAAQEHWRRTAGGKDT